MINNRRLSTTVLSLLVIARLSLAQLEITTGAYIKCLIHKCWLLGLAKLYACGREMHYYIVYSLPNHLYRPIIIYLDEDSNFMNAVLIRVQPATWGSLLASRGCKWADNPNLRNL